MKRRYTPWSFLSAAALAAEIILLVLAWRQQLSLPVFWALTPVAGIVAALAIILGECRRACPPQVMAWRIAGRMLTLLAALLYAATAVLPRGIPVEAHLVYLTILIVAFFCFIAEMSARDRAEQAG